MDSQEVVDILFYVALGILGLFVLLLLFYSFYISSKGSVIVQLFVNTIVRIYFRKITVVGHKNLPKNTPALIACAPHHNQLIDPLVVQTVATRKIHYVTAAVTYHRKFVGLFARLMGSIPVDRAQDMKIPIKGKIIVKNKVIKIYVDIPSKYQISPGSQIQCLDMNSKIATFITENGMTTITCTNDYGTKEIETNSCTILPKIDQEQFFHSVKQKWSENKYVGIFPEGGSHDRPDLLPLKVGCSLMTLSYYNDNPDTKLCIIPVGLHYSKPFEFRSEVCVVFGDPIYPSKQIQEKFAEGSEVKRKAVQKFLDNIKDHITDITISCQDFDTLHAINTMKELYKPSNMKLTKNQDVQLTRLFTILYHKIPDSEEMIQLLNRIKDYNNRLDTLNIEEENFTMKKNKVVNIMGLIFNLLLWIVIFIISLPGLILSLPIILPISCISKFKAKQAKEHSSVKLTGSDVIGTWKVITAAIFVPVFVIIYSVVLMIIFGYKYGYFQILYSSIIYILVDFVITIFLYHLLRLFGKYLKLYLNILTISEKEINTLQDVRKKLKRDIRDLLDCKREEYLEDYQSLEVVSPQDIERYSHIDYL